MVKQNQAVLGISPGTRHLGIAVFEGGELVEWCTKVCNEGWSEEKLSHLLHSVSKLTDSYGITAIAVKEPDPKRSTKNVGLIVDGITEMAERAGIEVKSFTTTEIKYQICPGATVGIEEVFASIVRKYQELMVEYEQELINLNPYHVKMFEAVCVGFIFGCQIL